MDQDFLVWGAGAVGGAVGAALAQAGHSVGFVDQDPDHVAAIRDPGRGLVVTGPVRNDRASAPAWGPDDVPAGWRRVLLCVKAQDTAAAVAALAPRLADGGFVVSLQNGLCEDIIAERLGVARTVGGFVNFAADWLGPGQIAYGNRGALAVGELDGRPSRRVHELRQALTAFEPNALATDNIRGFLWGKLAYAALLYAQALGVSGIADCWRREDLDDLFIRLVQEVLGVAEAEGVSPVGFNGFSPELFRAQAPRELLRANIRAMATAYDGSTKTHSGVWRDLAVRRRRTEVDEHLGRVIAIGRRRGLACPTLERLVAMIHEIENGARPLSDANLLVLARAG
ncbi:ketopantoate reductase family protein [Phenylobacterium sp.]|uniref:ketopantoate reductase family protein n=1 Tax=Phenylobacterium sp. TaxID=1871053 RepID=UPI00391A8E3B